MKYLPGRWLPAPEVSLLFNRLVKPACFYFVLSAVGIRQNVSPLAERPKAPHGRRHGEGIIESEWICVPGSDNPKLCLIARVKMASSVGAVWLFIEAWDWTQLEGFQHFCFVRCYSGFEQILALCLLQGLIGRRATVQKLCVSGLIRAQASNN